MKKTLWISVIALALLSLTCFSFAQGITATTNAGTPGSTAWGASLSVPITVASYATVTWGAASVPLTVQGPVGWVNNVNCTTVPLNIASNCNVTVTVTEGIGNWIHAQGIATADITNQADSATVTVWQPAVTLFETSTLPAPNNGAANFDSTGVNVGYAALPAGSGNGGQAVAHLVYGGCVNGPDESGTGVPYSGHETMHAAIGVLAEGTATHPNTANDGTDWTKLPAAAVGTPLVWAMISAP
jgi:hypothetical protein